MPHHRIHLTPEEDRTLQELKNATSVPLRVRERAEALRLSMYGWTVPRIAAYSGCAESTVRETFRRWWDHGLAGLFEATGRGARPRLTDADFDFLRQQMQEQPKAYNSQQLAALLHEKRGVQVNPDYLRQVLKKKASAGKESGTASSNDKMPRTSKSSQTTSKR